MKITVVNVKDLPEGWQEDERYIYVGRAMPRQGIKGHPLGNPFKIGKDGNRSEVIESYIQWFDEDVHQDTKMELFCKTLSLHKAGKDIYLACWCAPESCHADHLKEFLETSFASYQRWRHFWRTLLRLEEADGK